jgi:hypothetical protein
VEGSCKHGLCEVLGNPSVTEQLMASEGFNSMELVTSLVFVVKDRQALH